MSKRRVRGKLGFFVTTKGNDLEPRGIVCAECGRLLARNDAEHDCVVPCHEELMSAGAVPVPNFGWFCSQEFGNRYEQATGIKFARDADGRIRYYP